MGFALELGLELAGHEEGVIFEFDQLDQRVVRGAAADDEVPLFLEEVEVFAIKDIAIAVAFRDLILSVNGVSFGAALDFAGVGAQVHSLPMLFV